MSRKRLTVFLLVFVGSTALGLLVLQAGAVAGPLWRVKTAIARTVGTGVSAIGIPVRIEGSNIHLPTNTLQIIDECTGVYAFILLASFILAYPQAWRRKGVALLAAVSFITVVNWLRLVALGVLLDAAPGAAKFAHDYLWQVVWGAALVAFAFGYARSGTRTATSGA